MPKPIQNPIVGQALQLAFGLQGRVEPSLDEIITPVVVVGELGRGAPPPVQGIASARGSQPAVATEYFRARFESPGNILAVIRRIHFRFPTAGILFAQFDNADPPEVPTAGKAFTDGRLTDVGRSPSSVITYGTKSAILPGRQWGAWVPTDGLTMDVNWIVGSGRQDQFGFLEFGFSVANVACDVFTIEWQEYSLV